LRDALHRRSDSGNREGAKITLAALGRVMRDLGEYGQAHALIGEGLRYAHAVGLKFLERTCLDTLGSLAIMQGQTERAGRLYGAAAVLDEQLGAPPRPF